MQHFVHVKGCSSTKCLGTTYCAARRGGQDSFNAVSEFSPFVQKYSLVPSREEKIRYVPRKERY